MNICVIGWYGFETLGDRAILDGIIYVFSGISRILNISIGALYPVLTERTLYEDGDFYARHCDELNMHCFNVKEPSELQDHICQADIVIMGGGPLMDLDELYIIQHAFKSAKKEGIPTALVGCGYGPLIRKEYIKCVHNIMKHSDLVIMRSEICKMNMEKLRGKKVFALMDPAELSVIEYAERLSKMTLAPNKKGWVMNIRDLGYVYGKQYENNCIEMLCVKKVLEQIGELVLMPMHTFSVGGDDRFIQSKLARQFEWEKISAIQKPLSLKEAYELVYNSEGCIGMRYHSIVFQTYLNGNNYAIDYTDSKSGKIKAFFDRIDQEKFYTQRYYSIFESENTFFNIEDTKKRFIYDLDIAKQSLYQYRKFISNILRGKN